MFNTPNINKYSKQQLHTQASHKSNPSSITRGIVKSYCTVSHVGGGNSCRGYTVIGVATSQPG